MKGPATLPPRPRAPAPKKKRPTRGPLVGLVMLIVFLQLLVVRFPSSSLRPQQQESPASASFFLTAFFSSYSYSVPSSSSSSSTIDFDGGLSVKKRRKSGTEVAGSVGRGHEVREGRSQEQEEDGVYRREVLWLGHDAFPNVKDFFSASWLMNMDNFLQTNVSGSNIPNVEAGCFGAFRNSKNKLRLSLDWLDFSVEHLSKWWKVLECPQNPTSLNFTVNTLLSYASARRPDEDSSWNEGGTTPRSPLRETLALIAFQPYRSNRDDREVELEPKYQMVTASSLAATVASLVRVGMGRILVVGYGSMDEDVVREAFRILDSAACGAVQGESTPANGVVCVVNTSELAYVRATDDLVRSKFRPVNLPRAALAGLMRAKLQEGDVEWRRTWLGPNPDIWRYVYLTEPDTLLHSRPLTLQHIKAKLDDGYILVPHRLQPIPHEADVAHTGVRNLVTSGFKEPEGLNSRVHACCDAQEGLYHPGRDPNISDGCGYPTSWWQCGFYKTNGNHTRLEAYQLIRLSEGTGIVTLAGNEQGRRCTPTFDGPCQYKK